MTDMTDTRELADRFAAVWNEADAGARREAIAELWAPNGVHYVKTIEARGYAAIEKRVVDAYQKNVRDNGNRFRAVRNAQALRNVIMFDWEMVPAGSDEVLAVGREFLILDEGGRIITDYQFIVS
jgi:hypothetical protein